MRLKFVFEGSKPDPDSGERGLNPWFRGVTLVDADTGEVLPLKIRGYRFEGGHVDGRETEIPVLALEVIDFDAEIAVDPSQVRVVDLRSRTKTPSES